MFVPINSLSLSPQNKHAHMQFSKSHKKNFQLAANTIINETAETYARNKGVRWATARVVYRRSESRPFVSRILSYTRS